MMRISIVATSIAMFGITFAVVANERGGAMHALKAKIESQGFISKAEYMAEARKAHDSRAAAGTAKYDWNTVEPRLAKRFAKLDSNSDGQITREEASAARNKRKKDK